MVRTARGQAPGRGPARAHAARDERAVGDLPGRRLRHRRAARRRSRSSSSGAPATSASATSSSARAGSSTPTSGRRCPPTTAPTTGSASTSPSTRAGRCPTPTAPPDDPDTRGKQVDIVVPEQPIEPVALAAGRGQRRRDRASRTLSFHVDQVGVPVLVKVSYFPNWEVDGAEGPYRVAPNMMVVVPTEQRRPPARTAAAASDLFFYLLTLVGIGLLRRASASGATSVSTARPPSPAGRGRAPADDAAGSPAPPSRRGRPTPDRPSGAPTDVDAAAEPRRRGPPTDGPPIGRRSAPSRRRPGGAATRRLA